MSRAVKRRNKTKTNIPKEVRIISAIVPYRSDPIINFKVRYQNFSNSPTFVAITRQMALSVLIMGNGTTTVPLVCQAVRLNRVTITTSINASIEWTSQYGPTSMITVSGTSTTAAGIYSSRPPKNSTASFWSQVGANTSEVLMVLLTTTNDYIDVDFSAVLYDQSAAETVNTTATPTNYRLYRSYLDGPAASATYKPVNVLSTN
jgi:hypothetical protein